MNPTQCYSPDDAEILFLLGISLGIIIGMALIPLVNVLVNRSNRPKT